MTAPTDRPQPGELMTINLDTYYRGLAASRLQEMADSLITLSREAEQADAHDAAFHLADLSTQLLDMGVETASHRSTAADPLGHVR